MKNIRFSRSVCFLWAGLLIGAWSGWAAAQHSSEINGAIPSGGIGDITIDEGGWGIGYVEDKAFSTYSDPTGTSYFVEIMAKSSALQRKMGGYLKYSIGVPPDLALSGGAYGAVDNYFTNTFFVGGNVDPAPVTFSVNLSGMVTLVGLPGGGSFVGVYAYYSYVNEWGNADYRVLQYNLSLSPQWPYVPRPVEWAARVDVNVKSGTPIALNAILTMDMGGLAHPAGSLDQVSLNFYDSLTADVLPGPGVILTSSAQADEDIDGDGFTNQDDCDDFNPDRYPGAAEICDDMDNDCDSLVDLADGQCNGCTDGDGDAVCDGVDNCPQGANADQTDSDEDRMGDACDNCPDHVNPNQGDTYPPQGNSCGNACECEGNFDGDPDQDGTDAFTFKQDFGRSSLQNPCTAIAPCNGDFLCDSDVDGTDAFAFKLDFGRMALKNPCANCVTEPWCEYP